MSRTNVVLDDRLIKEAFAVSGARTKKELLHEALQTLVRVRNRRELWDLAGKIQLTPGFNHKSLRRVRGGTR